MIPSYYPSRKKNRTFLCDQQVNTLSGLLWLLGGAAANATMFGLRDSMWG